MEKYDDDDVHVKSKTDSASSLSKSQQDGETTKDPDAISDRKTVEKDHDDDVPVTSEKLPGSTSSLSKSQQETTKEVSHKPALKHTYVRKRKRSGRYPVVESQKEIVEESEPDDYGPLLEALNIPELDEEELMQAAEECMKELDGGTCALTQM